MKRSELLNDLKARTATIIEEIIPFKSLSHKELNQRNSPGSWSILECLEHLNLYGKFYLPEIDKRINASQLSKNEVFKSSWLGNYFALSMLPGENGKLNKMKTFKSMNPLHQTLTVSVIEQFLAQQHELLHLLERATERDLTAVKTSISISKLIKLRLGDTLRVVVFHNQRHMRQANLVLDKRLLTVN